MAVAGTLGTTGLYRLYVGHPAITPISPEAPPEAEEDETDWDDAPNYVYEPTAEEKQQLQEKLAPKLAPILAGDEQDDPEVIPLGSQEVPEGLVEALKKRRKKVSHDTANDRRREMMWFNKIGHQN